MMELKTVCKSFAGNQTLIAILTFFSCSSYLEVVLLLLEKG